MNKSIFIIIFFVALSASFGIGHQAFASNPTTVAGIEQVTNFRSEITLDEQSHLQVTETITYDFGAQEGKHGIYRNIPYTYTRNGSPFTLRFKVVSVTDPDTNTSYAWTQSKTGGDVKIKIGDANTTVSGVRTYQISYEVDRAINYFSDHDELYWNVTGNEWEVPIQHAEVVIALPIGSSQNITTACYSGEYGSTATNCEKGKLTETGTAQSRVEFSAENLAAYGGLSIVVGVPTGVLHKPSFAARAKWFLADNWILFLPIIALIALHIFWMRKGRDPKVRQAVMPEYEPVDSLRPGELGTLWDEKADTKDISATIIDFAVRGFLKIKALDKKNYQFTKLPVDISGVSVYEKKVWDSLFLGDESLKQVELATLKNKFYKDLKDIQNAMYEACVNRKYFDINPNTYRNIFFGISGVAIFASFFLSGFLENTLTIPVFILIAILFSIYGRIMPKRTVAGVQAKIHISGFKWFLSVTETERLKFHNAPAKKPELFERYLPYAMVLGVEKEWAGQFVDIYTQPPSWYDGGAFGTFNAIYFASAMSSMTSNMNSTLASHPSSAGSGGSGFGGGGFSGGGFGGGGGGSW